MIKTGHTLSSSSHIQYNFIVIVSILVLGNAINIMSTDMYTPSLPHLSDHFLTTADLVKLTISLNVVMLGVGQLVLGPLSDRYGRRPILLGTLCLFAILTLICTVTQSIEQLIVVRMFQGFMAAGHAVISLAIYKDLFTEKQQVKAIALSGMAVALAPAIAPIIGGYIHVTLGWKYNFYIVGTMASVTIFLLWKLLPESSVPDKTALQLSKIKSNCWMLLTNKVFVVYSAMTGIGMAVIFIFAAGASFVFIQTLNVPAEHFGYFQAVTVLTYFVGNMISAKIIEYKTPWQVLNLGIAVLIVGGLCLAWSIFSGNITRINILLSFSLMTFGISPLFAIAFPKAMQATHKRVPAGIAASMLGAIEMTVAGSLTMLLSVLYDGTVRPLGYTIIILMILMVALWFFAKINDKSILDHDLS